MKGPKINILLATCNGAAFLQAQLQSLLAQEYDNWLLHVSDDGSSDATVEILREFQQQHPELMASPRSQKNAHRGRHARNPRRPRKPRR